MKLGTEVSLAIGIGWLVAGVSWWSARATEEVPPPANIPGFSSSETWDHALEDASGRGVQVLVYGRAELNGMTSLESALGADPALALVLEGFEPVVLETEGAPRDQRLCEALGIVSAPSFVLVDAAASPPSVTHRLRPTGGSLFDRHGLAAALTRWSSPESTRAAGPQRAPKSGAVLRREAELEGLTRAPLPTRPPDGESALEEKLVVEADSDLLYRGLTHAATILHLSAEASRATGEHLGVPRTRWERRLREVTRKAWIHCPDEHVRSFGPLLLERYARQPEDLDSLDQAFAAAVRRTLGQ